MLFSILASDGIALPLSPAFPAVELRYILENSGARVVLATEGYASKARELVDLGAGAGAGAVVVDVRPKITQGATSGSLEGQLVDMQEAKGGLMLYTSGTTNRPVSRLLSNGYADY
jgi:malonyl-CoA/methylmalonyl-CoA synthetase